MQFTCRATVAAIHFPTGFPGFIVNAAYVLQVLNAYGKVYPTPPPSRRPIRVKQARLAAEQAAHEAHQRTVNEQGTALEETDKAGRHKLGQPPKNCLARRLVVLGMFHAGDVVIVMMCEAGCSCDLDHFACLCVML